MLKSLFTAIRNAWQNISKTDIVAKTTLLGMVALKRSNVNGAATPRNSHPPKPLSDASVVHAVTKTGYQTTGKEKRGSAKITQRGKAGKNDTDFTGQIGKSNVVRHLKETVMSVVSVGMVKCWTFTTKYP